MTTRCAAHICQFTCVLTNHNRYLGCCRRSSKVLHCSLHEFLWCKLELISLWMFCTASNTAAASGPIIHGSG